jgi:NADH:ubiquinone oxidoreductase subunit 2 (subunit N)
MSWYWILWIETVIILSSDVKIFYYLRVSRRVMGQITERTISTEWS